MGKKSETQAPEFKEDIKSLKQEFLVSVDTTFYACYLIVIVIQQIISKKKREVEYDWRTATIAKSNESSKLEEKDGLNPSTIVSRI